MIGILKTDRTLFAGEFIFAQIWAKTAQKAPKQGFWDFLENFVINFSQKQLKMKTNIVIDISQPIPYLRKFWLTSQAKMLLANQVAGFFKM